jgi:hypothetical protein
LKSLSTNRPGAAAFALRIASLYISPAGGPFLRVRFTQGDLGFCYCLNDSPEKCRRLEGGFELDIVNHVFQFVVGLVAPGFGGLDGFAEGVELGFLLV